MTDQEPRFCPRCGTSLVPGLSFCPSCGLNTNAVGDRAPKPATVEGDPPAEPFRWPLEAESQPSAQPPRPAAQPGGIRRFVEQSPQGVPIILGALIVAAGLVLFGLLMRPQGGANPQSGGPTGSGGAVAPGASAGTPPVLITGLTIESPADGQAVATKAVTVIGLAPPGLSVTRDVSFGLDQHAAADGTGHWAISVDLNEGQNDLVFRIGDDRSTEKRLRVIFRPQAP